MKPTLCLCTELVPMPAHTRVVVVVHDTELRKSTNTGRLLPLLLPQARIAEYGANLPPLPDVVWDDDTQPVVLFPREGAPTIDTFAPRAGQRPLSLIVLDGTWRQATRLRKRFALSGVPFARLPDDERPGTYKLRSGHFDGSLSTIEATARALRALEGERGLAIEEHLMAAFRKMQDRTLWLRGTIDDDDVEGGLPAGARRHDINGRWRPA